jgi:hypothetical protein
MSEHLMLSQNIVISYLSFILHQLDEQSSESEQ